MFIGAALSTGRRGARTPAIVTQLLLLPVVYSLIGPSRQLLLGIAAGIYVVVTFLLLISERSREWVDGAVLPRAVSAAPSRRKVVHSSIGAAPSVR